MPTLPLPVPVRAVRVRRRGRKRGRPGAWVRALRARLRALARDEGAAVGPMIAVLAVSLLAVGGLALDVGLFYVGNRDLRAATEAAALAAAMDPANAQARARGYLTSNGYDPGVLQSVTTGRYCADSHLAASARFDTSFTRCPGNGRANAVRLTTSKPSRRFLTGIMGNVLIPDLAATATAARIDEAGVAVTSGLITVTNSLVNAVNDLLGALLGIKLRLSTADIEALMGGNVDAGLFFDNLAQRTGQTGTYGELVAGTYSLQDIVLAAADATKNPATAASLRVFGTQVGAGHPVPLAGLFGLGVWQDMPVGEADARPALRAGMNAYQLIAFAVQAGNATLDLSGVVNIVSPGSTARIAAIATGPVDRPRFSFGPAGETQVGTSALRLQVLLSNIALNVPGILNTHIGDVPVLLDVAAAQAEVSAIDCLNTAEQRADTRVTVTARSGLVNAYIGTAPANAMTSPMPTITAADIGQANLLDIGVLGNLLRVTAKVRAVAQPVFGNSGSPVFGPGGAGTIGDPGQPNSPGTPASVGNGSQLGYTIGTLVGSLSSGLDVDVTLLGLCLPIVCSVDTSLIESTVLGALLPAIVTPLTGLVGSTADPLLDNVLAALGVQLGHATVWVTGARCGVPVLV
ncbi:TadG family pilus assembly protein [Novosphingobium album (ex Liu et al. 2023)]|uniref:TadG family pilus assembly protein n=1 Tax=Novosphingobium album (ex Liu et al. 2023) TaxID=3031130 RepID=A0ABT5WKD5_9SPHN|nr:pilus assembly protein TadG-related protein [Novosphingobium album (ex Liu et al. 2023)]MDE8650505.1 TadG family pilus assembly protein [Novosphingobium album (ex Liu et al. 2023)]